MTSGAPAPLRIFLAYSHEDQKFREDLTKHLSVARRLEEVDLWHDRVIEPGNSWEDVLEAKLDSADVFLPLLSASFFASDYCVGKEMKRAFERRTANAVIILPVLVRDFDWQGHPIAEIEFLRKTAISTEKDPDAAWKDVSEKVRAIHQARARQGADATTTTPGEPPIRRPRRRWALLLVALLVVAGGTGWGMSRWGAYSRRIEAGDRYLRIGRGEEARREYESALRLNPIGPAARLGLRKVELLDESDPEVLEQEITALRQSAPDDPDLSLLLGNLAFSRSRLEEALAHYTRAIAREPRLAQAHGWIGVILEQRGELLAAIASYDRALAISGSTPRYRHNKAHALVKLGREDEAISEYQLNSGYPLSQIELAKLALRGNRPRDALGHLESSLRMLTDPGRESSAENRGTWSFAAGTGQVELTRVSDKICYVRLLQALGAFVQGATAPDFRQGSRSTMQACTPLPGTLRDLANTELRALVQGLSPARDYQLFYDTL
jgi:hypothetical protein